VALRALEPGERVEAGGSVVEAREQVPNGHKPALRKMMAAETVRKFGSPVGGPTAPVSAGGHIHAHNLRTFLSGVEGYRFERIEAQPPEGGAARRNGEREIAIWKRGVTP
jgi:altronate hydrolase